MGQFFMAVNVTKKECFLDGEILRAMKDDLLDWETEWAINFREWCANPQVALFPYLLRKSDEQKGYIYNREVEYAGRWAGDEVYLVGDYDSSDLYFQAQETFRNIGRELVKEYNWFIREKKLKLKYCKLEL
jgi:hypothetical protein